MYIIYIIIILIYGVIIYRNKRNVIGIPMHLKNDFERNSVVAYTDTPGCINQIIPGSVNVRDKN